MLCSEYLKSASFRSTMKARMLTVNRRLSLCGAGMQNLRYSKVARGSFFLCRRRLTNLNNNKTFTTMKKVIILCVALFATLATFAQNSGLGFNYQAVVRNVDGILLANSNVTLRVSLYPGQMAASPTWVETHAVQTDMYGSFDITVGHGTRATNSVAANFSDVNFASVYYWIKIEIMEGSSYREVSYAQLPSAPYCEVAHNATAVPAGSIIPFAGPASNIPAGWMLCDGSEVSRSAYANLYSVIGVAWGTGNGSTTFNLPDLRGVFLRGVAGTDTVNDPDADTRFSNIHGGNSGNNVGSYQGDAIRNIAGYFNTAQRAGELTWQCYNGVFQRDSVGCHGASYEHHKFNSGNSVPKVNFDASYVVPVGSDNRPKNVYVTYIIKY